MYDVCVENLITEISKAVKSCSQCGGGDLLRVRGYNKLAEILYNACDNALAEIPETLNMQVGSTKT